MQPTLTSACKEVLHVYSFVHQSINTFMQFLLTHQNAARQQQSKTIFPISDILYTPLSQAADGKMYSKQQ
jgi:hypothetical protein